MAKFKAYDYRQRVFLPVSLEEQLMPFAPSLNEGDDDNKPGLRALLGMRRSGRISPSRIRKAETPCTLPPLRNAPQLCNCWRVKTKNQLNRRIRRKRLADFKNSYPESWEREPQVAPLRLCLVIAFQGGNLPYSWGSRL
jgi:hypothetical protein